MGCGGPNHCRQQTPQVATARVETARVETARVETQRTQTDTENPYKHRATPSPIALLEPWLSPGPWAPAFTQTGTALKNADRQPWATEWADTATCARCHSDIVREWNTSAHAWSSFSNPWYHAVVDQFRNETSFERSRFCAGCHDPMLLISGGIDQPVRPTDPLAHAGITCLTCHGSTKHTTHGNGSYTLDPSPITIPKPGDPTSLAAHRKRLGPDHLREPTFCGSCHRSFLSTRVEHGHFQSGIDDLGGWQASQFATTPIDDLQPADPKTCTSCHMPEASSNNENQRPSLYRSHRFLGAHTGLHRFTQTDEHWNNLVEQLRKNIAVHLLWWNEQNQPTTALTKNASGTWYLDVVISNNGVGHHFPGGTRDTQDTQLQVKLLDDHGHTLTRSTHGLNSHNLRSIQLQSDGTPQWTHAVHTFASSAQDHTIPAGHARIARYAVDLNSLTKHPTQVSVQLLHRRHNTALEQFACSFQKQKPAFRNNAHIQKGFDVNSCQPLPSTPLVDRTHRVALPNPSLRQRFLHARALLESTTDHWSQADTLLKGVTCSTQDLDCANLTLLRARLWAQRGKPEEAERVLNSLPQIWTHHASVRATRAMAWQRVWNWENSASALQTASRQSNHPTLQESLGLALFNSNQMEAAVTHTWTALGSTPHAQPLWRIQALTHQRQQPNNHTLIRQLWTAHALTTPNPQAHGIRDHCQTKIPGCFNQSQRIPVYPMQPLRMESPHH